MNVFRNSAFPKLVTFSLWSCYFIVTINPNKVINLRKSAPKNPTRKYPNEILLPERIGDHQCIHLQCSHNYEEFYYAANCMFNLLHFSCRGDNSNLNLFLIFVSLFYQYMF